MNMERALPPPIPEVAKRKGPPPIPEAAKKKTTGELAGENTRIVNIASIEKPKKGPPPIPKEALKPKFENIQAPDVVEAFEVKGFDNMEVVGTMEKKDIRKGKKDAPNEDNVLADPATGLVGVFDGAGGMGGRPDLAAKAAERMIPEHYKKVMAEAPSGGEIQTKLVEQMMKRVQPTAENLKAMTSLIENSMAVDPMIGKTAYAMIEAVKRSNDAVKETKGSTMAIIAKLLKAKDGNNYLITVNTGDTGAIKRRNDGSAESLVPEDSLLSFMKDKGLINDEKLSEMKKNPDEKHTFGKMQMSYKELMRTATGGLGQGEPNPSLSIRKMRPGEEVYLASDGLIDKYDDPETDEIDMDALGMEMADEVDVEGNIKKISMKDKVNRMRKDAKARKTYKADDDVAIVGIRVK